MITFWQQLTRRAELYLISATSQKGKRNAANRPDSSAKKAKKWAPTPDAIEILLKYIKEYKTKCEFNGVNFKADLSGMYTEVRWCSAVDFPHNFGPESCQERGKEL